MIPLQRRSLLRSLDAPGLALIAAMLAAGAVLVSSATHTTGDPLGSRQLLWDSLSLLAAAAGMLIPLAVWLEYGYLIYAGCIALLVYLPIFGNVVAGAKSWLQFGFVSFQPSELAKVATILTCAAYIRSLPRPSVSLKELAVLCAIVLLPLSLTLLQPDFGTATTFLPIAAACFFLGDFPLKAILKWSAWGALVLLTILLIGWLTFFKPYQKERLKTFLDPGYDPKGAGYQVNQAKIAVGSGELLGKGLRSGSQNRMSFLPRPHTDFIFGVAAEETGFVGSMALLALFAALLNRLLSAAHLAQEPESRIVAVGAFGVLSYHLLVNVGMVLGILPTTGIPLPFLSYGGSSLLSSGLLVGIALNVRARPFGGAW